jgi:hypothetical protein
MENFYKKATETLGLLLLSPLLAIYNGFVISKLWMWFIVPVFGLSPIRIIEGIGIQILLSHLFRTLPKKNEEAETAIVSIIFTLVSSSLTLLLGYIYSLFM